MIHSKGRKAKLRNKKPVVVNLSGLPWRENELIALAKDRGVYQQGMIRAELIAALS